MANRYVITGFPGFIATKLIRQFIRDGYDIGHFYFLVLPAMMSKAENEALDYFTCKATYDCTQTKHDLEGSGIACPDFREVIEPIVRFYREHKNDPGKQLSIR